MAAARVVVLIATRTPARGGLGSAGGVRDAARAAGRVEQMRPAGRARNRTAIGVLAEPTLTAALSVLEQLPALRFGLSGLEFAELAGVAAVGRDS